MPIRKIVLFLILVIVLTYANSLFNDFIGDDHILLFNNTFYKNFSNLKRLISPGQYIIKFSDIDSAAHVSQRSFSGGVSYRPVSAFSIFVSYFLWKLNPAGYHLDNIIMHVISCLLVFCLIWQVTKNKYWTAFACFIFATHPINGELVNVMSYRSDFLSFIFFVASLISYIFFSRASGAKKRGWLSCSYFAFFVALFCKENAATLPLVILAYDILLKEKRGIREILKRKWVYTGFFVILGFYLYVYLFVFPNANARVLLTVQESFITQWLVAIKILASYLAVFLFPFKISILPPLFVPSAASLKIPEFVAVMIFIVASMVFIFKKTRSHKEISFFLAWFFITYLPTSFIIPLPNPFSFRFMYLPIVGLCFLAGFLIERLAQTMVYKLDIPSARRILLFACVGINMAITIPTNTYYHNDFVACHEMIRKYPQASRPYWVLGTGYLRIHQFDKARYYLSQYLQMDIHNPFVEVMNQDYYIHHMLGRCFGDDYDRAIAQYKMALRLRPDYTLPYLDLSWAYSQKRDFKTALVYALKNLEKDKNLLGFIYAIHSYIRLKEFQKARNLLEEAFLIAPRDPYLLHYQKVINQGGSSKD